MSLMSNATLKGLTDKLAYVYERIGANVGSAEYGSYVAGTDQYLLNAGLSTLVGIGDYQQQEDVSSGFYDGLVQATRRAVSANFANPAIQALQSHMSARGLSVDETIIDLATYLTFYNTTPYSCLLHPSFGQMYTDVTGGVLPAGGLFQPSLHPLLNAVATNGMGSRAVGGSFTAGTDPDVELYSPPLANVRVITDFTGGSAPPTVTVAGEDDTGATTTTWTATLGSNNPVAAVSTTITPAVVAMTRVTVTLASVTGIVVGSVLTINAGLIDQEVVTVEAVAGSTITAVFDKAHAGGAAVTTNTTLVLTPSVAGRRLVAVTGITVGITGHGAGAVQVYGVLERQHNPS